ncbi:MAG: hypothetical protein QOJ81_1335 [Chloroflexota bacterium]|nr:hypothetical protein [Chloroflexota bacterium]
MAQASITVLQLGTVVQFDGGAGLHTGPIVAFFVDGVVAVGDPEDGDHTWTVDRLNTWFTAPSWTWCGDRCPLARGHRGFHANVLPDRGEGEE